MADITTSVVVPLTKGIKLSYLSPYYNPTIEILTATPCKDNQVEMKFTISEDSGI